jgi:lipid-A-disaccharide synthase
MPKSKRVMIVAGEASGDLHGARLVKEMRSRDRDLSFFAIGGGALKEAGARVTVDADALSVVGITEVAGRLPELIRALRTGKEMLRRLRPALLVLIDFPDFNLRLAAAAKKLGIPVLYYITPQVWAWRKGRVRVIRRRVDHAAVILPFEVDFFRRHGIEATYVGHPLLDDAPPAAAGQNGGSELEPTERREPVVGLLPGSRRREVARHLPSMMEAALQIARGRDRIRFLVSAAPSVGRKTVEAVIANHPVPPSLITITEAPVQEVFSRCTLVVAVSGTVTLQAALAGVPTVIIYRVSPLSYWIGRLLIRVPHIGLANLIAGRRVMPELIQNEAGAGAIAETVTELLARPERLQAMRSDLLKVRDLMGRPGAASRVADIAMEMIEGRKVKSESRNQNPEPRTSEK